MQVDIISTLTELEQLLPEWRALVDETGGDNVFIHPRWHLAWWRSMGRDRVMRVCAVRGEGRLMGVLPLAIGSRRARNAWQRVLEFSGGTQADRNDLIVQPGREGEVLAALERPLEQLVKKADLTRLSNIPAGSPLRSWLERPCRDQNWEATPLPYLKLEGDYDILAKSWRKSHRGDVGRQTRRLQKLGGLRLRVLDDQGEALAWLEQFLQVHQDRWAMKGRGSGRQALMVRAYLRQLILDMWSENVLHLSCLELDGQAIAHHFGFLWRGRLHFYKPAFAPDYANYSPSKVHVSLLLQEGFRQGWRVFDFLLGNEPYKYLWTSRDDHAHTLVQSSGGPWAELGKWWLERGVVWARKLRGY